MSKDPKLPAPKPPPAEIEIDVVNPRYEGATPEMVGRLLLQRPPKDEKPVADEADDEKDQSDD